MLLEGKTAIVTGASRGIGKAIAERFLREGVMVFGIARHIVVEAQEMGFHYIICDVSKESEVKNVFDYIVVQGNRKIDILVNAAGTSGSYGLLSKNDFTEWKKVFETNVFGTFLMMKYVLPQMCDNRQGKIINFSGGGDGPLPGFSAYSASKAAIVRLTETAAKEVREFGVCINAIAPGPVKTKLFDEMFLESGQSPPPTVDVEKTVELALFLASEKSNGLTGKLLSAVWDNLSKISENLDFTIKDPNMFTLRRVKGEL